MIFVPFWVAFFLLALRLLRRVAAILAETVLLLAWLVGALVVRAWVVGRGFAGSLREA